MTALLSTGATSCSKYVALAVDVMLGGSSMTADSHLLHGQQIYHRGES